MKVTWQVLLGVAECPAILTGPHPSMRHREGIRPAEMKDNVVFAKQIEHEHGG
jgi:hypothetical protein